MHKYIGIIYYLKITNSDMRKRLGALHADSLEEYIQLAKMSW